MRASSEVNKFSGHAVASLAALAAIASSAAVAGCLPKDEGQLFAGVERRIGGALNEVFDAEMDVECGDLPSSGRPDGGIVYGRAYAEGGEYTGKIRLAPMVCESAESIIDQATSMSPEQTRSAAFALSVIVHEGVHVASGDPKQSESDVNCKTLQRGYQVAKALGAAEEPAMQVQKEMTRQARYSEGEWTLADYQVTASCYDGGKLDMDPTISSPHIFPHLPPIKE